MTRELMPTDDFATAWAPIVIFAFNRPVHTQRLLESLGRNPECSQSDVIIFCDGARRPSDVEQVQATRQVIDSWVHPRKQVHKRDRNIGLERSVIDGVSQVCEKYGQVIVLEDDLELSERFLHFMNLALNHYREEDRVMQVSGHMFNVETSGPNDAALLPFPTSWGWATWQRAWSKFEIITPTIWKELDSRSTRKRFDLDGAYPYTQMLRRQLDGVIHSWAIQWRAAMFRHDGLALYPRHTLVANKGFDGTGTHCGVSTESAAITSTAFGSATFRLPAVDVDNHVYTRTKDHLRKNNSQLARMRRKLAQFFA